MSSSLTSNNLSKTMRLDKYKNKNKHAQHCTQLWSPHTGRTKQTVSMDQKHEISGVLQLSSSNYMTRNMSHPLLIKQQVHSTWNTSHPSLWACRFLPAGRCKRRGPHLPKLLIKKSARGNHCVRSAWSTRSLQWLNYQPFVTAGFSTFKTNAF